MGLLERRPQKGRFLSTTFRQSMSMKSKSVEMVDAAGSERAGLRPWVKNMRLQARTAVIENGFVQPPAEAPWLADDLAELTAFPASRHDDQVNSIVPRLDEFNFLFLVR